jgi:hypothetical protein
MASTFDLTGDNRILCGADYGLGLTLKDGSGAAINLTGCTLASQIRRTQASSDILATFSVTITSASGGTATLSLTPTQTAALPATASDCYWKHDVLLTRADGTKIRILEGDVEVDAAVTRS